MNNEKSNDDANQIIESETDNKIEEKIPEVEVSKNLEQTISSLETTESDPKSKSPENVVSTNEIEPIDTIKDGEKNLNDDKIDSTLANDTNMDTSATANVDEKSNSLTDNSEILHENVNNSEKVDLEKDSNIVSKINIEIGLENNLKPETDGDTINSNKLITDDLKDTSNTLTSPSNSNTENDSKNDDYDSNKMNTDEPADIVESSLSKSTSKMVSSSIAQMSKALINTNIKNTSLGFLQAQYESDSDSSSDEQKDYREKPLEIDSDTSDDSDIEIVSVKQYKQNIVDLDEMMDDDEDDDEDGLNNSSRKTRRGPVRVKGELLLEDLPPIEDLHITVPEAECVELGKVHSIVDQLVLVNSLPGTVPLNLDTVLFLENGKKVLGEIFDVLGQISTPLYCVRFNSNDHIKEKGIEIGQTVYVAPRTEHTQFVILPSLINIRGSDASWENDIEPSEKHIEFSDDEEEKNYRKSLRNRDRDYPNKDSETIKRTRTFSGNSASSSTISEQQHAQRHQRSNQNGENSNYRQRWSNQAHNSYQNNRLSQAQSSRPRFNYNQNSNGGWHSNYNSTSTNNQNVQQNQNNPRNFNRRGGYRQNNYQQNINNSRQNNSNNYPISSNNFQQNFNNYPQQNQNNYEQPANVNNLVPNPFAINQLMANINQSLPPPPPPPDN